MEFTFDAQIEIYRHDTLLYTIDTEYTAEGTTWQSAREKVEEHLASCLRPLELTMFIENLEPMGV